jgi:hypothetical protein
MAWGVPERDVSPGVLNIRATWCGLESKIQSLWTSDNAELNFAHIVMNQIGSTDLKLLQIVNSLIPNGHAYNS